MTLRRFGLPARSQIATENQISEAREHLLIEMKRLNDYMALMTNEPSPPTEEDDTDATT